MKQKGRTMKKTLLLSMTLAAAVVISGCESSEKKVSEKDSSPVNETVSDSQNETSQNTIQSASKSTSAVSSKKISTASVSETKAVSAKATEPSKNENDDSNNEDLYAVFKTGTWKADDNQNYVFYDDGKRSNQSH